MQDALLGSALGATLAVVATVSAAAPLTALEKAGRTIYTEGTSPAGKPLRALIGAQAVPVDGASVPCVNCHGADGLGRPEGTVRPAAIRWRDLTRPAGTNRDGRRLHQPYTAQAFADALTEGKDAAGNKLDAAMPRFVMSYDDIAALVAYLKRIETDFDPGVGDDRLRVGTLLPADGRFADLGASMAGVLRQQVAALNAKGGIYGRRLELVTAPYSEDRAASLASAEKLFRDEDVFAIVSPMTSGLEREIGQLAERVRVPVVGPFTLRTHVAEDVNRYTFFVLAGLPEQVRVLAEFATRQLGLVNPIVAVVHPDEPQLQQVADAAVAGFAARGWSRAGTVRYAAGRLQPHELVAGLQQRGVQVVLFLGTDAELQQLGGHIRDAIWTPYLLAPGVRAARAAVSLPNTLGNRVFLVYPTLPSDVTPAGAAALAQGQGDAGVPPRHQPAQASAYASMRLLEEALTRAGRDLSRARLIDALENLFSFETTVTPPLSFGPTRRIGASGGYVVSVDTVARTLKPASGYIRAE